MSRVIHRIEWENLGLVLLLVTVLCPIPAIGQSRVYSYIDENGHRIITNIPSERSPIKMEEPEPIEPVRSKGMEKPAAKGTGLVPSPGKNAKAVSAASAQQAIERAEQRARQSDNLASSVDRLAAQADLQSINIAQTTNLEMAPSVLPIQTAGVNLSTRFRPGYSQYLDNLITKYADVHGLEPDLVRAVIKTESNFNPFAISPKGARGLMQLMPDTARRYGVRRIHDPEENIAGGVRYLRDLLDMFQGNVPLALSGYNAGEKRVLRTGGIPNISETRNYIHRIGRIFNFDRSPFTLVDEAEPPPQPRVRRFVNAQGMIEITNIDYPPESVTDN